MGSLPSDAGAMTAVFASAERVESLVKESGAEGVEVAADNGTHRVVSGLVAGVEALEGWCVKAGVRCGRLVTSHAFHSGLMEPVLDGIEAAAGDIEVSAPVVSMVSNVTGRVVGEGELLDGAYWRRHARAPVAYGPGVGALSGLGVDVVIELGPGSVLGPLLAQVWPGADVPVVLTSQRRVLASEHWDAASGHRAAASEPATVREPAPAVVHGDSGRFADADRPLPSFPRRRESTRAEAAGEVPYKHGEAESAAGPGAIVSGGDGVTVSGGPGATVSGGVRAVVSSGEGDGFVEAVAGAWEAGLGLRFEGLHAGELRRRLSLPTYPFERERYWVEVEGLGRRRAVGGHPLLGLRHDLPDGGIAFERELSVSELGWLGEHRVFGRVLAPGALHAVLAAAVRVEAGGSGGGVVFDGFQMHAPLVLEELEETDESHESHPQRGVRSLQVLVGAVEGDGVAAVGGVQPGCG